MGSGGLLALFGPIGLSTGVQTLGEVMLQAQTDALTGMVPLAGMGFAALRSITDNNGQNNPVFKPGSGNAKAAPANDNEPVVYDLPYNYDQLMTIATHVLDNLDSEDPWLAVQALEKAAETDPEGGDIQLHLGRAALAVGDGFAASEYLSAHLENNPDDHDAVRLRIQAYQMDLEARLEQPGADEEIEEFQIAILMDVAFLVNNNFSDEIEAIEQLRMKFEDAVTDSPEEGLEILKGFEKTAERYLAMGDLPFEDLEAAEANRDNMNALAAQTYDAAEFVALCSPYEEVRARAPLYAALATLARGDIEGGQKALNDLRADFPEAEAIVSQMEAHDRMALQFSITDAWEKQVAQHPDHEDYQEDKTLITEVRRMLQEGEAETLKQALDKVVERDNDPDGSPYPTNIAGRAKHIVENGHIQGSNGEYVVENFVFFTMQETLNPKGAQTLLLHLDHYMSQNPEAHEFPAAAFSVIKAMCDDEKIHSQIDAAIKVHTGDGSFGDYAFMAFRELMRGDLPAELGVAAAGTKVFKAVEGFAYARLVAKGWSARKAKVIAYATAIGAEATSTWAIRTAPIVAIKGGEVSGDYLVKSYVANLIGNGSMRLAMGRGEAIAKLVKSPGLKLLITHSFGLGGAVGGNQINHAVGASNPLPGGFKRAFATDVTGYFVFAVGGAIQEKYFPTNSPAADVEPAKTGPVKVATAKAEPLQTPDLALARQGKPAVKVEVKVSTDEGTAGADEVTGVVRKPGTAATPPPVAATEISPNAENLLKVTLTSVEVKANVAAKGDPAKKVLMRPIRDAHTNDLQAMSVPDSLRQDVVQALKEKKLLDPSFELPERKEFIDVPVKKGRSITIWFVKPTEATAPAPAKTSAPAKSSSFLPEGAGFAAAGPTLGVLLNHFGASPIVSGIIGIAGVAAMFLPAVGMVYNRSRIYSAPEPLRPQNRDINVGLNKEGTLGWVTIGNESGYAVRRNGPEQILVNGKPLDPSTNWSWVRSGDVIKVGGKTYNFETGFEREPTSIRQGQREAGRPYNLDDSFRLMEGPSAAGVYKADAATDTEGRFVSVNTDDGRVVSVMLEGKGRSVGQSNAAVETEASMPADINGSASLETAILLGRVHFQRAYLKEDGTIRAGAPKLQASGVEMEANPADPNKVKARLVANGDIPLMVVRLGGGNKPTVVPEGGVMEMDLQTGNDVVVAGRSLSPDAIAYIVKNTQPATAQAMVENLQQEALIRAKIMEAKPQGGRLTAADYRAAYLGVTGREAPQGWHGLYEGGFLASNGKIYDGSGNPTGDSFSATPGGFLVQIAGK